MGFSKDKKERKAGDGGDGSKKFHRWYQRSVEIEDSG